MGFFFIFDEKPNILSDKAENFDLHFPIKN